jgi:hypothetical protein
LAPVPEPLADIDTLVRILASLGRTVSGTESAPQAETALHLTRTLVAAAEQQAVAAEVALAKAGGGKLPDGHDVADHQGTYDLATGKAALMMLAVTYWRAQRLHAGVQALAHAFTGADTTGDGQDSAMELVWDLTVPAATATEAILCFLAGVTTGGDGSTVEALDAATALLVSAGRRADRLRDHLGLEVVPDFLGVDAL